MQYPNTYICSCSILYLVYSVLYFHWQVSHCQGHSTSIAIQMPCEIIPVDEIQKYHSWTDSLSRIHICSRSQNPSWRMELSMMMTWYDIHVDLSYMEDIMQTAVRYFWPAQCLDNSQRAQHTSPAAAGTSCVEQKIQTPKILTAEIRTPKIQLKMKALLRGPNLLINLLPNFPCSSTHILSCPKKLLLFYFGCKSNPDRAIYLQPLARLFIANHLNCIGYC